MMKAYMKNKEEDDKAKPVDVALEQGDDKPITDNCSSDESSVLETPSVSSCEPSDDPRQAVNDEEKPHPTNMKISIESGSSTANGLQGENSNPVSQAEAVSSATKVAAISPSGQATNEGEGSKLDQVPPTEAPNEKTSLSTTMTHEKKDDEEVESALSTKSDDDTDDETDDEAERSLKQRAKDAAKRFPELGDYMQLVEKRFASLEKKAKKHRNRDDEIIILEPYHKRRPVIPELRRVTWAEFKNQVLDNENKYAIEALVGPVKYYYQRLQEQKPIDNLQGPNSPTDRNPTDSRERVERIRINSLPILTFLANITNQDWAKRPTVILNPFKVLVCNEASIREKLATLETKWAVIDKQSAHCETTDPPTMGHAENPPEKDVDEGAIFQPIQSSQTRTSKQSVEQGSDLISEKEQVDSTEIAPTTREDKDKARQGKKTRSNAPDEDEKADFENLVDSLEAFRDLRCLVQFMDEELMPIAQDFRKGSRERILFRDLWHLFKPGDEVLIPLPGRNLLGKEFRNGQDGRYQEDRYQEDRYQEDWKIIGTAGGRANLSTAENESYVPRQKINPFKLCCYHIDFNGQKFMPIVHDFKIFPFEGEREITSLEVYPARYHPNAAERRTALKSRGEIFRDLITFRPQHYKGPTLTCHPCGCDHDDDSALELSEQIDSQVVVDFGAAIRDDKDWKPFIHANVSFQQGRELRDDFPTTVWKDAEQKIFHHRIWDPVNDDSLCDDDMAFTFMAGDRFLKDDPDPAATTGTGLREEDLILLPARVLAYVFQSRKFSAIHIDHLRPLKRSNKAWNDLKLPTGHKEVLKALVGTHLPNPESNSSNKDDYNHGFDIIQGKERGLLIHLHGVSGVGKTSTAECIAASFGKLIFPILCSDLARTPRTLGSDITELFHRAQSLDSILLLDEADAFVGPRPRDDNYRHSLMSVFLRALDSYAGVAFITTNTEGKLDSAFKSRINLSLYYPQLNEKQTIGIWKTCLRQTLERKNGLMIANEAEILELAKYHYKLGLDNKAVWNGRQIRNAFQTAAALAEFDAQGEHQEWRMAGMPPGYCRLEAKHFQRVAEASGQFDTQINSAYEAARAEKMKEKADKIDRSQPDNAGYDGSKQPVTFQQTGALANHRVYDHNRTIYSVRPQAQGPPVQHHQPMQLEPINQYPQQRPPTTRLRKSKRFELPNVQTVSGSGPRPNAPYTYPGPDTAAERSMSHDAVPLVPRDTINEGQWRQFQPLPTANNRAMVYSQEYSESESTGNDSGSEE